MFVLFTLCLYVVVVVVEALLGNVKLIFGGGGGVNLEHWPLNPFPKQYMAGNFLSNFLPYTLILYSVSVGLNLMKKYAFTYPESTAQNQGN